MNKAIIISGEASETDSEDEDLKTVPLISLTTSIQGAVITGEDSESENENEGSICSAISALDTNALPKQEDTCDKKCNSLLHQKLRECNGKLHHDIEHFCQNVLGEAGKNLVSIDQHLVKSQVVLQNAVTSLKSLSSNSQLIKNKLQSLLSAHFVPNIKTDN